MIVESNGNSRIVKKTNSRPNSRLLNSRLAPLLCILDRPTAAVLLSHVVLVVPSYLSVVQVTQLVIDWFSLALLARIIDTNQQDNNLGNYCLNPFLTLVIGHPVQCPSLLVLRHLYHHHLSSILPGYPGGGSIIVSCVIRGEGDNLVTIKGRINHRCRKIWTTGNFPVIIYSGRGN